MTVSGPGTPGAAAGRPGQAAPAPQTPWPGARTVQASWAGTLAFVATAGLATVAASTDMIALAVALWLFTAGTVAFTAAFAIAVRRSRTEEIVVPSLFFLQGSAPAPVRRLLFGSLAVEVLAAFVTAGVRPNTSLAFGILAPMYGLGMAGLWAARHGRFPPRPRPVDGRRRNAVGPPPRPGYHRPSEPD